MAENLRNMTHNQGKAKSGQSQISGEAKEGADWHAKNETKEYVSKSTLGPGQKGGKNAGL